MPTKKPAAFGQTYRQVLRFTLRHWANQPWRIAGLFLLFLLSAIADVVTPIYAGRLADAVASGAASDALAWDAAITSFLMLSTLGLTSVLMRQAGFSQIITLTLCMMRDVGAQSSSRIQHFSTDWHANSFAGSTVRKITRGMWALDLLNDTLIVSIFSSLLMLVGATVVFAWHWPVMGVVVGTGAVIFVGVTTAVSLGWVAPAARLSNSWDTRMGGVLADAISCNPVVKAFGAESREESRYDRVLNKWQIRTRRTWIRATRNGGLQGLMLLMMQVTMLATALMLWRQELASVGDITFSLTMFFVLKRYLGDIGMDIRNLQRSVNDMEEMVAMHGMPPGVRDAAGAPPIRIESGEIVFDHMTFHYGVNEQALYENFSMRIAPGERVGLVGHSGSGKTTFVKLVQRLYDVSSGRILIDGQDIAQVQQSSLRSQIAIVQQEPTLFHRSLAENIAYGRPDATQADIERAARQASAHDFIMRLPKGYGTLVGERGVKLSWGERQRVAIARAFLADAPILILDEATSSLDSESEMLIQQAMERLMAGRTTLVIAHRLSTVRALDRLLVMAQGKVIEEGSHQTLIQRPPYLFDALLFQFARQGATVHAQASGRLRNIEIGLGQRLVNALPFQRLDRGGAFGQFDGHFAFCPSERGFDVVGVRRLGQIVAGTQFDGFDGSGNAGKTRQHDDQHERIVRVQGLHASQAGRLAFEFQIDHGVSGSGVA